MLEDIKPLERKGYTELANIDLLRAAIAWPGRTFGLYPEEILIGLSKGSPNYPEFTGKKPAGNPDADLWDRHMRIKKPNQMNIEDA
jgi:hypothetical protein